MTDPTNTNNGAMTRLELIRRCARWDACDPAMSWLRVLDVATAREAWDACDEPDWLLWLAAYAGLRTQAVQLACDCAERVLPVAETWLREHAPEHAEAPRRAIEAARRGEVTRDVTDAVNAAVGAARAPADAAYAAARAASDVYWAATTANAAVCANVAACASCWAARAADADQRDNDVTERAWQLARLREVIAWDDVERGLRGVA